MNQDLLIALIIIMFFAILLTSSGKNFFLGYDYDELYDNLVTGENYDSYDFDYQNPDNLINKIEGFQTPIMKPDAKIVANHYYNKYRDLQNKLSNYYTQNMLMKNYINKLKLKLGFCRRALHKSPTVIKWLRPKITSPDTTSGNTIQSVGPRGPLGDDYYNLKTFGQC